MSERRNLFMLIALYTLSFGLMLFNKGLFWDDWVWYGADRSFLVESARQQGAMWFGYYSSLVFSLPAPVFIFRLITFFSFLGAGLFLNEILKTIREMPSQDRFMLVLFFLLFPVNNARIAFSVSQYAVSYFLFFAAFWLLTKDQVFASFTLRLSALALFFVSFGTNSLLVFYVVPAIYVLNRGRHAFDSVQSFLLFAAKKADFIILPLVFWMVKKILFAPYGSYQGYNTIQAAQQLLIVKNMIMSFKTSFALVLVTAVERMQFVVVAVVFVAMYWYLKRTSHGLPAPQGRRFLTIGFFLGIAVFIAGVFAYNAVGYIPCKGDWASRHQLLVPFGASLMLLYALAWVLRAFPRIYAAALSMLVALFVSLNVAYAVDYQIDWYKQLALVDAFKHSEIVRDNTTFAINDQTIGMNADGRTFRFYEYTALMRKAFGDTKRFASNKDTFKEDNGAHKNIAAGYVYKEIPDCTIVINPGTGDRQIRQYASIMQKIKFFIWRSHRTSYRVVVSLSTMRVVRLLVQEYFFKKTFMTDIAGLITLSCVSPGLEGSNE